MVNSEKLFQWARGEDSLLACGFFLQTVHCGLTALDPLAWSPGGGSYILWAADPQLGAFDGFLPGERRRVAR